MGVQEGSCLENNHERDTAQRRMMSDNIRYRGIQEKDQTIEKNLWMSYLFLDDLPTP